MKYPVTPAIHMLRENDVPFVPHLFRYQEKGGTSHSSRELGVAEHAVIKTLVMEDETKEPLVVLMHGDRQVSTKELARQIGCKSIAPCKPEVADRHSGYQIGGTSPFGTRKKMRLFAERSIFAMEKIWINGGGRGFLVEIAPADLQRVLQPTLVDVALTVRQD
ncbi:MAG: aminoacyl-tRNA deacylase [Bdellovibrionota bacterium]